MNVLTRDVWRSLRSTPIVSLGAVMSLALGIGANTAIFSIVNGLMLRPLPVEEPHQLALVLTGQDGRDTLTYPIWQQLRQRRALFGGVGAWASEPFNIAASGRADLVEGVFVSGGLFEFLGLQPVIGRGISEADDSAAGGPDGPVAVIGFEFWQRRFGGDRAAVGRTLTVGRHPVTIVGVAPAGFFGLEVGRGFDVAVPFSLEPMLHGPPSMLSMRTAWWPNVVIRRKADQSLAAAAAALRAIQPSIRAATLPENRTKEYIENYLREALQLQSVAQGISRMRPRYERPLTTIMAVVILVLLVACANVANLLMARATSRRHELSVRRALGASGLQLGLQLLGESAALAGAGAALGLALAVWGSRLLGRQLSTGGQPAVLDLPIDWRVLAFTAAVAACTAVVFGTVPAFRAARVQPNEVLKRHGRGVLGVRSSLGSQALVVGQVTFSLVLVCGAGFFIRTFHILTTRSVGFTGDRVLVVRVEGELLGGSMPAAIARLERLQQAAADVPGVASAAVSAMTPVNGARWEFLLEQGPGPLFSERDRTAPANLLLPGYFETLGTRLLVGRDFLSTDRPSGQPVVIVNQAFAKRFFDGQPVVGRHIRQAGFGGRPAIDRAIIGVAEDAVYESVRQSAVPTVYLPLAQRPQPPSSVSISVRAAGTEPALLTGTVLSALGRVEPGAVLSPRLLSDQLQGAVAQERLLAVVSGLFGALALVLAGLGLYGVTAYAVVRRRTEIGVRMALGASPCSVMRLVLTNVGVQVAVGIAAGTLLSLWAAGFVQALLYGLPPHDALTLASGAMLLVAVGAVAGWLPARRAARLDPARVLRDG